MVDMHFMVDVLLQIAVAAFHPSASSSEGFKSPVGCAFF
jgi:hypothetical protein